MKIIKKILIPILYLSFFIISFISMLVYIIYGYNKLIDLSYKILINIEKHEKSN